MFYYVTVMNENYAQPSLPTKVREGILRGMYRVRASSLGAARVRLLGAGTILREALAAAELLESEYGVAADVYSATSFTELRREAMALQRAARLGGPRAASWVEQQLPATGAPVVAASDYVSSVPDLIRPWIGDRYRRARHRWLRSLGHTRRAARLLRGRPTLDRAGRARRS